MGAGSNDSFALAGTALAAQSAITALNGAGPGLRIPSEPPGLIEPPAQSLRA